MQDFTEVWKTLKPHSFKNSDLSNMPSIADTKTTTKKDRQITSRFILEF